MANNFPTGLNNYPTGLNSPTLFDMGHVDEHNALEAKVGINGSAVTTSHDYKLSGVTTGDKAVSKTGTETLTNKTLTSPTLTTPVLGVATATTINKVTITTPATGATLTITDGVTATLPSTDTYVGRATTDTLTNKTLTSPVISTISNTGTITLPTSTDTLVGRATTDTLTNKRIEPRVVSAASYTTDTGTSLSVATADTFIVTAQAGALKFNNPGGTPINGQKLVIRIKDNGTARALTYDTQFRASTDLALPTTTVLSKTLYMGFMWNNEDSKWDLLAVLNNF